MEADSSLHGCDCGKSRNQKPRSSRENWVWSWPPSVLGDPPTQDSEEGLLVLELGRRGGPQRVRRQGHAR